MYSQLYACGMFTGGLKLNFTPYMDNPHKENSPYCTGIGRFGPDE